MKLIIDISEQDYQEVKQWQGSYSFGSAIANGIPLPTQCSMCGGEGEIQVIKISKCFCLNCFDKYMNCLSDKGEQE